MATSSYREHKLKNLAKAENAIWYLLAAFFEDCEEFSVFWHALDEVAEARKTVATEPSQTIRKLTQVGCCPECHSPRSERRPYYVKNDPNDKSETFTTENSHTCTNSWHWALSTQEGE